MANIILHQFEGIAVGLDRKDGYLNATKLCIAYNLQHGTNKQPSDWTRSKKATEYIAYVASILGIPRNELVVSKQGNSDESGTWIHPDLGDDFAAWLSVEYKYKVSQLLQQWRQGKYDQEYPRQLTGDIASNPTKELVEKVSIAIDAFFQHINIELRTGMKIEAACNVDPSLRPILEPHKPKVLLESPLLSPTDLGALMNPPLSARAVNKLLCDRNLQERTGDKNPNYRLIGSGNEFGKVVADTARGHGKTVQYVRWYQSVIDFLG
jgi:hypothetical protein